MFSWKEEVRVCGNVAEKPLHQKNIEIPRRVE